MHESAEQDAINWADPEAGAVAWRTFERLAERWHLTLPEKLSLLSVTRASWYQWQQDRPVKLDEAGRERLSYLLGIYAALRLLLPVPERAHERLRKPNRAPLFSGSSAMARMRAGDIDDLKRVRAYLDAQLIGKA
jgi:hypothetical protein